MKKSIFILTILSLSIHIYAESNFNVNKIAEFKNDKNLISIRPSAKVAPQDDATGNRILFNDNGDLFIYNWDKLTTFKLNEKQTLIKVDSNFDFSDLPCLHGLDRVSNDYLYYSWTITSYMAINQKTGERKFQVSLNDIFWNDYVYYDEKTDILFFRDAKSNMHSIIHPGLDDKKNRNNYKTPAETLEMLNSNKELKNLGLYKGKYLTVNGDVYYWAGTTINHINYQIFDNTRVNIWNNSKLKIDCSSSDEQIESIAIHPSGDIYILRMNWKTNTHNLYYIENTWDPEWREQWYNK